MLCPQRRYKLDKNTGELNTFMWRCRKKACYTCMEISANETARRIIRFVGNTPCHHLMLSMHRCHRPLHEANDELHAAMKKLMRTMCWRNNIKAGVWFYGLDFNLEGGVWGPHIHLIIQSDGFNMREIESAWQAILLNSWVAAFDRLPRISDRHKMIRYCARQRVTILDAISAEPDVIREYERAVYRRRLAGVFGSWFKKLRLTKPKPKRRTTTTTIST